MGKKFSLLYSVQTGSGAHPTSYPVGTGGSLLCGKAIVLRRRMLELYLHSPSRLHGVVLN
jgi:hypothetical protein